MQQTKVLERLSDSVGSENALEIAALQSEESRGPIAALAIVARPAFS
jgi:hypothetical protein